MLHLRAILDDREVDRIPVRHGLTLDCALTAHMVLPELEPEETAVVRWRGAGEPVVLHLPTFRRDVELPLGERIGFGAYELEVVRAVDFQETVTRLLQETPAESIGAFLRLARGEEVPLPESRIVSIGRSEQNDIALQDQTVSRFHAAVFRDEEGRWQIKDKSSTGTRVNDLRVDQAELTEGTIIDVGSCRLRFHLRQSEHASEEIHDFHGLLGVSKAHATLVEEIERLARSLGERPDATTVVIEGETGTGKERVAQALYEASGLKGPFVVLHCGTLTAGGVSLGDLFGYSKGAFTGADQVKKGVFEQAEGGMVFLDELGELPFEAQQMLLRVIQERKVRRLGEATERSFKAALVCATNADLTAMTNDGEFRKDLYYRLRTFIRPQPLRARRDDIRILARHFASREHKSLSEGAIEALAEHNWPGNVRELENVVVGAALRIPGTVIQPQDLELQFEGDPCRAASEEERRAAAHRAELVRLIESVDGDEERVIEILRARIRAAQVGESAQQRAPRPDVPLEPTGSIDDAAAAESAPIAEPSPPAESRGTTTIDESSAYLEGLMQRSIQDLTRGELRAVMERLQWSSEAAAERFGVPRTRVNFTLGLRGLDPSVPLSSSTSRAVNENELRAALEKMRGSKTKAAELLGVNKKTIYRMLRKIRQRERETGEGWLLEFESY